MYAYTDTSQPNHTYVERVVYVQEGSVESRARKPSRPPSSEMSPAPRANPVAAAREEWATEKTRYFTSSPKLLALSLTKRGSENDVSPRRYMLFSLYCTEKD